MSSSASPRLTATTPDSATSIGATSPLTNRSSPVSRLSCPPRYPARVAQPNSSDRTIGVAGHLDGRRYAGNSAALEASTALHFIPYASDITTRRRRSRELRDPAPTVDSHAPRLGDLHRDRGRELDAASRTRTRRTCRSVARFAPGRSSPRQLRAPPRMRAPNAAARCAGGRARTASRRPHCRSVGIDAVTNLKVGRGVGASDLCGLRI